MNLSSEGTWIYEFISAPHFKSHGSLHANERFWVSLHVLYVLIKHCCAMFAFSRGCDRYEHAKVCIPRTALPVSQMNQVSLRITIKVAWSTGKKSEENVSESERAKAKQSSEWQKNRDINLSSPSEDPSDPAGPVNHGDLEHLATHYGSCPSCEKTFTLTHTAYDKHITSPALHLICHMSFSRSFRVQKDLACPCRRLPFNSSSKSHMRNDSSLPVSMKDLLCSLLSDFLVASVPDPDKTACRNV